MDALVFGTSDPAESARLSRAVAAGKLRRIARGIYTSDVTGDPAVVVRQHIWHILAHLFPGAVISHRTAIENRISDAGTMYLTTSYTKRVELPGVTIMLQKGPGRQPEDSPLFGSTIFIASPARALLENMQVSRARDKGSKTLSQREVELWIERKCSTEGREALVNFRTEAHALANRLGMTAEAERLHHLVAAILGSATASILQTAPAIAAAKGNPYDTPRIDLFTQLAAFLQNTPLPSREDTALAPDAFRHRAFFEAYFSNFIEGTEFEIEEAERIVFANQIPSSRPKDAHDVLGTYRLASSSVESRRVASSADELLSLIRSWHNTLMAARPETRPGEFKTRVNRVGSRVFVAPELVRGTFIKAWDVAETLKHPFARALFWKFALAEIHPFDDGNGRISRLLLNAHLSAAGLCRIIFPTVFREDYMSTLSALTNNARPQPYILAMEKLQQFTSEVGFSGYETAKAEMIRRNAFKHASEGNLIWEGRAPQRSSNQGYSDSVAGGIMDVLAATDDMPALPQKRDRGRGRTR